MDYTKQPFMFKLKKAIRYIFLYGVNRTIIKIKGQYHSKRIYDTLPLNNNKNHNGNIGIIGCGNFAFSVIAYYLKKNYGYVIRAAMDNNINKAASLYEEYKLLYYTDDADKVINDPEIDLIFIASNHASHAEYAIKALEQNKHIHIEKPHVVSDDQLIRLCIAAENSKGKILSIGYNRPRSQIGQKISHYLQNESGETMINWFIAGHEIPKDHWYFHENEGGRILGNLCHWTDFTLQMIPSNSRFPITINPTSSIKSDCDIAVTYTFADGSIAAITFSAKGHTFEGVKERFAAHKGNILISMDDFKTLIIENFDKKIKFNPLFRDHGHEKSIKSSYESFLQIQSKQGTNKEVCSISYIWETGKLFLLTKQALEENKKITLEEYKC